MKPWLKTLIYYALVLSVLVATHILFPVGTIHSNFNVFALLASTLLSAVLAIFYLVRVLDDKQSLIPSTIMHFAAGLTLIIYLLTDLF